MNISKINIFQKLLLGTFAIFAGFQMVSQAQAADLGGDCCADLEERVAELEATTVRKGNRKVSLKVSGFVSKSVMFWDDGDEDDVYVADTNGGTLSSNFSFSGSAQINGDWSAGYNIVVEAPGGPTLTNVSQEDDDAGFTIDTLVSSMYIKSNTLGKLSWGKQSQASDNAALLPDLSGTIIQSNYVFAFHGGAFEVKAGGVGTGLTWGEFAPCGTSGAGISLDCNGAVLDNVRYDTPTIAGFSLSASWGEDDFWDIAVNYAGKVGDVKIKAAYAYTDTESENFSGYVDLHQVGASVLHVPTGLFVYGAYVTENVDPDPGEEVAYTDDAWYVKGGIQAKFSSLGKTVLYGEYGEIKAVFNESGREEDLPSFIRYGAGVVQYVDAASLQLHALWKRNELEDEVDLLGDTAEELDMFIVGGTIFF